MMPARFRKIETLLGQQIGLDTRAVGLGLIRRAIHARMSALGIEHLRDYEDRLDHSPAEVQALIEEVVIPESWFFRDGRPFDLVREQVGLSWLRDPALSQLRALSVPCAGGEEPYSLAILFDEIGLAPERCRIDGVDVSQRSLDHAQLGVYSANAFRGTNLRDRDRTFHTHPQGFEIDARVRSMVRFIPGNVLDPSLLRDERPYDLILCRNLLIYLDPPGRAAVLTNIDRLLAADGILVIGHADRLNLGEERPRFAPMGDLGAFAYRRASTRTEVNDRPLPTPVFSAASKYPLETPARSCGLVRSSPPAQTSPAPPPVAGAVESAKTGQTASGPHPAASPSASHLEQAMALADLGRHDEAIALCEQHLRQRGPDASAFHLLGVICLAAGRRQRAEECFHKAVYLDPTHDEALLALALSADRRGDLAASAGFRRRAERALTKKGTT